MSVLLLRQNAALEVGCILMQFLVPNCPKDSLSISLVLILSVMEEYRFDILMMYLELKYPFVANCILDTYYDKRSMDCKCR